jgi:SAM-dependent methyltransferase
MRHSDTPPNEIYTHGHHPVVVAAHGKRTAAEAAAFLLPRLRPGMSLLDVGCGPGSITRGLADTVGEHGTVVGIDNSDEAIALAGDTSNQRWLRFEVASVYELPFADGSFDVAYGHQVLQHLADPVAALIEMKRVLRPGGLIAARDADYGTMTHYPQIPEIDRWLELYHAVARAGGGEPDAGRRLADWVAAAGFVSPQAGSSTWTYATAAERADWAGLWAERITKSKFADRAVDLGLADRAALSDIAAGWRRWAATENAWFGFIHGEILAAKPE